MMGILKYVFTNRFGNTLAILNFVLIAFNSAGISQALGAHGLFSIAVSINMPAHIFAAIASELLTLDYFGILSGRTVYSMFDLGFIYLQWVVIGSLSCVIADAIRHRCAPA